MLKSINSLTERKYQTIEDFLKSNIWNNKEIILYGAGTCGAGLIHILEEENIPFSFFCDRDVKKQGAEFYDIKVISPEDRINIILQITEKQSLMQEYPVTTKR